MFLHVHALHIYSTLGLKKGTDQAPDQHTGSKLRYLETTAFLEDLSQLIFDDLITQISSKILCLKKATKPLKNITNSNQKPHLSTYTHAPAYYSNIGEVKNLFLR